MGSSAPPADALGSVAPASSCLSIDDVLQLVQGELHEGRREIALAHLDVCLDCQLLVAGAAQALRPAGASPSRPSGGVFEIGAWVAGRYRIERFIARGGMGEVYAAYDSVLDEVVALKTVRAALPDDGKAIRRLKSEVQLARRIGHPNTCRIYELGEHQTETSAVVHFFTMGLVEGETLGSKLRNEGALPLSQVITLSRQVLSGMAEAHSLGILHRDLKSDNIMLRAPANSGLAIDAVIMDFGLALRLDGEDRLTSDSHALVGSAAYMAPEQVEGEKLTAATDVYAFGVILFEMLTGRLPFRAATPAATALQRLRQQPPAPSSFNPSLDVAWDRLVLGCLERAVERRFRSAREVLEQLEAVLARPAPRPWLRRPAALASALVIALGAAALGLTAGVPAEPSTARAPLSSDVAPAQRSPASRAEAPADVFPPSPAAAPISPPRDTAPPATPRAPDEASAATEPAPPAMRARAASPSRAARRPERRAARVEPRDLQSRAGAHLERPAAPSPLEGTAPTEAVHPAGQPPRDPAPRLHPSDAPVGPLPIDSEFPG